MSDDSQKQGSAAAPRGVAGVGLPLLERKPLLVWLLQGLFLLHVLQTGLWLVGRALGQDSSSLGKVGIALAIVAVGIVLLVVLQRRAPWSHVVSCICLAAIAGLGCMQNLRAGASSQVIEYLGLYVHPPADNVPLVPVLLWATLAIWVAVDARMQRYFAAPHANVRPH